MRVRRSRTVSAAAADATTSASIGGRRRCNYECDAGCGRRCNYECDACGEEGFHHRRPCSIAAGFGAELLGLFGNGMVQSCIDHSSMHIHLCQRMHSFDCKEAEEKHLMLVHTKNHVQLIKNINLKEFDSHHQKIASRFNSIYFNNGSTKSACLAAGSVIDASWGPCRT